MTTLSRQRRSSRAVTPPTRTATEIVGDKYRLEAFLGAGGVGEVWQAHNEVLDVPVAVKLLHVASRGEAKLAARMANEARATARLTHPAIVKVFDFGATPGGDPFLVMELLRGETLASMLEAQGRLSATYAVQLLLPIVEGLAAAHALGIVHRDIKPENVFIASAAGRVQPKLLDFGIARIMTLDRRLTLDGALVGTPEYMSPEQARGRSDLDFRSDIWSLCVVLYELVAGSLPFRGDNYHAVLSAVQHEQPAPLTAQCAGDEELWQLIQRGLAKHPLERWACVQELGVALARWLLARGVSEDVCGASLRRAWLDPAESSLPPVLDPERIRSVGELETPSDDRGGTPSTPPLIGSIRAKPRRRLPRPGMFAWATAALALALWVMSGVEAGARAAAGDVPARALLQDSSERQIALRPPPPAPPPLPMAEPPKKKPRRAPPPQPVVPAAPKYDFGF